MSEYGNDWQNDNMNGYQSSEEPYGGQNYGGKGNPPRRRLVRSAGNRMICGVCAGIAEYFDWDPAVVRILWVAVSLLFGAGFMGLIAYFIVAVIMPEV